MAGIQIVKHYKNKFQKCRRSLIDRSSISYYISPQMGSANPIRVLLVDDDVRVRHTLSSILKPYSNIEVVGEASDRDEAVTSVRNLRPTVVVMDISMKKMDGITAARLIKAKFPDVLVVGCSAHAQEYNVYAMKRVCAFQVLLKKDDATKDLYPAIERVTAASDRPTTATDHD
jgi:DNA-binding NarL/FixJ family response regulator